MDDKLVRGGSRLKPAKGRYTTKMAVLAVTPSVMTSAAPAPAVYSTVAVTVGAAAKGVFNVKS